MGFLYDQGTEKAGESGENEAPKEDKDDEGDLTEAQEGKVSVRLWPQSHWPQLCA